MTKQATWAVRSSRLKIVGVMLMLSALTAAAGWGIYAVPARRMSSSPSIPLSKIIGRSVDALTRAEKVRLAVESVAVRYSEKSLPRITISVGVAYCPAHEVMPQDLPRGG